MKKRNKNSKSFLLLASLALIVTAVIGTTMAYLVSDTPTVTNTFTPAEVDSEIDETLGVNLKSNVRIQNSITAEKGIDAYIRAKVVITWQNDQKQISAEQPKLGEDYRILDTDGNVTNDMPADSGWVPYGDFYYWTSKVAPQASTGNLIDSIEQIAENEGYNLHVEILADAIQAEPANVVTDVWGFTPPTTNN